MAKKKTAAKAKSGGKARPKAAPKAGKAARPAAKSARAAAKARPASKPAAAAPKGAPAGATAARAAPPAAPRTPAAPPRPPKPAAATPAMPRRTGPTLPAGLAGTVRYDEPLSKYTTFRIGGPATVLFTPGTAEAAATAVAWAKASGLPWMVLGNGSSVLVRDGGFRGLVLKLGKGLDDIGVKGATWTVGAGVPTQILARRSAEAGLEGLQRLIGVPGSVGGGVFLNSGAHGQDFAGVLVSVQALSARGELRTLMRKDIGFGYRRSGLDGQVVLGAVMRFEEEDPVRLKNDMAMVMKRRRAGTPFDQPCCGSVFRNPEGQTAGRLIDRCGLKGRRVGGAVISPMHGNYIVNKGGATADDVLRLMDIARTAVFKEFGHDLQLAVRVIGEAK